MNDAAKIPTWNLLPSLGFRPGDMCRLLLDFGNLELSAVEAWSPRDGEAIYFGGVLKEPRTLTEVEFALPRRVESLRQCAAWIVWNLDQHSNGRRFRPARQVDWIQEGRENRRLLPWVMSQAEYDARPQCIVQRDWLRLALKNLCGQVASLPDNAIVVFGFDGAVFSIRCDTKLIAFPVEGAPWTVCFRVEARTIRQQSKRRHMRERIGISIWKSRIELGPWSYDGVVGPLGKENFSEVQ
jgi:hypothetical protein